MGTHYENYQIEDCKYSSYPVSDSDTAVVIISWKQGRRINEYTWSINSLDLVLGVIGGLSGIVWATLAMVFGGYESFKYQNSLIGAVYPTAPYMKKLSRDVNDGSSKAKQQLMQTVAERGKYWYNYSEYLFASILDSWCCSCFKKRDCYKRRVKRLRRHEHAFEKLAEEIDVVKLLYV